MRLNCSECVRNCISVVVHLATNQFSVFVGYFRLQKSSAELNCHVQRLCTFLNKKRMLRALGHSNFAR